LVPVTTIIDTFYSIARRFGIAVEALAASNPGVDPNWLQIGQQICVPAPVPPPTPCPGRNYTLRPGDTLIGIARREGYTLDALIAVNPGINLNAFQVGQVICLPPSPGGGPFPCFGGSIYIIRPGNTFYSIARRFGVSLNQLLTANPDIDPVRLRVGDPLCIPR
jgi:LysM repeat protein